jgi:hypothetical protein
LLLAPILAFAQLATSLDTHPATGNTGPDVWTYAMDANNEGIAVWKHTFPLPLNPSGNIPFAGTFGGDLFMGDAYCLADADNLANLGAWGCIYGKSRSGQRVGPVILQANKVINGDSIGGSGIVMWADRANADNSGNRGYTQWIAWGQPDTPNSDTFMIGNRDPFTGALHWRVQIQQTGGITLLDLPGSGNAHLCVHADGTMYRGTGSTC